MYKAPNGSVKTVGRDASSVFGTTDEGSPDGPDGANRSHHKLKFLPHSPPLSIDLKLGHVALVGHGRAFL